MNLRIFCLSILVSAGCSSVGVSKTSQPAQADVKVSIDLQDGSRVVGRPGSEKLECISPLLGKLQLPFSQVRLVQWTPKTGVAKLRTVAGDEFQVKLAAAELPVKTAYGSVKVPAAMLRRMQVSVYSGPADLRRGLLALWSGENDSQDSVEGHHGTMMHGAAFAEGKVGRAFYFASDQGRVYIPDAPDFVLNGSFSFAAWVKSSEFNNNAICVRGDDRPGMDTWTVSAAPGNQIDFHISSPENTAVTATAPVTPNEWVHLVCAYDEDASQLRIFVNGQLAVEKETTCKPVWQLDSGLDPSVCLGNVSGKFHRFPFRGLLDEVALYGRALSEADAQALTDLGNAGERITVGVGAGTEAEATSK